MPLVVFGLVQLQELRKALGSDTVPKILAACAVAAGLALLFSGYFGAFSQRVAALFGVRCLPTQTFNFFLSSPFFFFFFLFIFLTYYIYGEGGGDTTRHVTTYRHVLADACVISYIDVETNT